ncbi:MAG TPA: cation-transporting P-type ATPase [Candidatus Polarisedimenticolaceae bacterium]|nr:cation-transporting P-type ATPase [Candidatus Polarisedimenticolaceae bacterium]
MRGLAPVRELAEDPHRTPIEELFSHFASSPRGLTAVEAEERLRHDGPNVLTEARPPSLVGRLGRHVGHRFALLLWAGAALALLSGHFSPTRGWT